MSPDDVLAKHKECRPAYDEAGHRRDYDSSPEGATCCFCEEPWPCDAVSLARQLVAAREALEKCAASAKLLRDGWFGYDPDLARILGDLEAAARAALDKR